MKVKIDKIASKMFKNCFGVCQNAFLHEKIISEKSIYLQEQNLKPSLGVTRQYLQIKHFYSISKYLNKK